MSLRGGVLPPKQSPARIGKISLENHGIAIFVRIDIGNLLFAEFKKSSQLGIWMQSSSFSLFTEGLQSKNGPGRELQ